MVDEEDPSITCPSDITVNTDIDQCGAVVNFDMATAEDNSGEVTVEQTSGPASGTVFPTGTTTITYTATDAAGNTSECSFDITVEDDQAPAIDCPDDIMVDAEVGADSAVVTYPAVTATDNCEGVTVEMTAGLASGSEFPLGDTTVTYTATDANGNTVECSFTVTVTETIPNPPAPPTVGTIVQATCAEPTGTIQVTVEEGFTYSIDGSNYQADGTFSGLAPGTYQVTARDEFGQISEATAVTLDEPVAAEIETTTVDLCVEDSVFDLFELFLSDFDETGNWIDTDNTGALDNGFVDPSLLEVGSYTFEYVVEGTCPSSTLVTISINDDCVVLNCTLDDVRNSISKVVTPNGDMQNDYFRIGEEQDGVSIECDFTYDVQIFNRWGKKIFSKRNYQPRDWDGFSQGSNFGSSDQLPSGTYYYVIEVRNSSFDPITGYIYLGTK